MSRAVTGGNAGVAARLKFASEWMLQSSLPMLLAHRNQAWQANAVLLDLLQASALDPAHAGTLWPPSLRAAVSHALEQDHPAPVYECALGSTPARQP